MTVNLSEREMTSLERIAERRGLSKTQLVRQAIRLYESVTDRLEQGDKLYLEDAEKSEKSELVVL